MSGRRAAARTGALKAAQANGCFACCGCRVAEHGSAISKNRATGGPQAPSFGESRATTVDDDFRDRDCHIRRLVRCDEARCPRTQFRHAPLTRVRWQEARGSPWLQTTRWLPIAARRGAAKCGQSYRLIRCDDGIPMAWSIRRVSAWPPVWFAQQVAHRPSCRGSKQIAWPAQQKSGRSKRTRAGDATAGGCRFNGVQGNGGRIGDGRQGRRGAPPRQAVRTQHRKRQA